MNQVIGELLPSALGVALSPIPIIAVILMLGTPNARSSGSAFGVGWMVGLLLVSVVVLALTGDADDSDSATSTASSVVKILFGLMFFALAVKQWRSRPKPGDEPKLPPWMASLNTFGVGKCFAFGALLSGVNPKNLALTFSAAATIAEAGLSSGESAVAVGVYVVIGSVSVAGPVLAFLVLGDRAVTPLASVKQFMSDNIAVIMIVLFVILGAKILGEGYAGLTD